MEDEAKKWNKENPESPVSHFACKYPGQYRVAAETLRSIREEKNKSVDTTT